MTPALVLFCPEYNIFSLIYEQELITGIEDDLELDLLIARATADALPICLVTDWILLGEL